jgi:hypothetical protein
MKIITRNLLPFQEDLLFSPIRTQSDYVKVLVYSARILLQPPNPTGSHINATMKLIVDKMSRLFFYKKDKYISIAFPFIISNNENEVIEIITYTGGNINHKNISDILLVVNNSNFQHDYSLIGAIMDASNKIEDSLMAILEEVFQFELSYIRYDFDKEREKDEIHPLHHLDVNTASSGTYKLGLTRAITQQDFEDLLNINTQCSFIG